MRARPRWSARDCRGVVQQDHHRAHGFQIAGDHGPAVGIESYDDLAEPPSEVVPAAGQRQDRHDLGRRRDDEPGLAGGSAVAPADARDDAAQGAVVHVHGARPENLARVEPQLVAEMQCASSKAASRLCALVIGVEIAVEMEVDLVHRRQRRAAAAGSSALLAEHGPSGSRRAATALCPRLTSPCVSPWY